MIAAHPPKLLKHIYPSLEWEGDASGNKIYLTFDDGPCPGVTDKVLELLEKYKAKATFFCVGDNVVKHPDLFQEVLVQGHAVGNHTFNHLNGWSTKTADYVSNVNQAALHIPGNLFRPPYGRIKPTQINALKDDYRIIMWSHLSMDYNPTISNEKSIEYCKKNLKAGSVLVMHDSQKSAKKLFKVLEEVLDYTTNQGFTLDKLA